MPLSLNACDSEPVSVATFVRLRFLFMVLLNLVQVLTAITKQGNSSLLRPIRVSGRSLNRKKVLISFFGDLERVSTSEEPLKAIIERLTTY